MKTESVDRLEIQISKLYSNHNQMSDKTRDELRHHASLSLSPLAIRRKSASVDTIPSEMKTKKKYLMKSHLPVKFRLGYLLPTHSTLDTFAEQARCQVCIYL